MQLYNETQNKVIASNVLIANSFFKRLKGLLGKKRLDAGECMLITPCNSIHTFFMAFSINVIFLDKESRVLKVVENLKPWRFSACIKDARFVIEMSSHRSNISNIKVGDTLSIKSMQI